MPGRTGVLTVRATVAAGGSAAAVGDAAQAPALSKTIAEDHRQSPRGGEPQQLAGEAPIYIAIEQPSPHRSSTATTFPTLVCQAVPAALSSLHASYSANWAQHDQSAALLPRSLARHLGVLSWRPSKSRSGTSNATSVDLRMHAYTPVVLSSVVLATSDPRLLAGTDFFRRALSGRVLRQGDSLHLRTPFADGLSTLLVVMTEPVLQGAFVPEQTQVTVARSQAVPATGADHLSSPDMPSPLGPDASADGSLSPAPEKDSTAEAQGEDDDVMIDESFLSQQLSTLELDGPAASAALRPPQQSRQHTFEPCCLSSQAPVQQAFDAWCAEEIRQESASSLTTDFDEESAVLLDENHLAMLGAFNGDWLLASPADADGKPFVGSSSRRLVRGFSWRAPRRPAARAGHVYLSPLLLHNLLGGANDGLVHLHSLSRLIGKASSTPAQSTCLPIPFAESLIIARIASPISVDRRFESLFLDALRLFFQDRRRIVKSGDVVAMPIDGSKIRWAQGEAGADGEESKADRAREYPGDDSVAALQLPANSNSSSAIVYFQVQSATTDLDPAHLAAVAAEDQLSFVSAAWTGELGCMVDSDLCKITLSAVTRKRVPNASAWLQVGLGVPPAPQHVGLVNSPLAKLTDLLQATLLPRSASFGLHLTVLLKGARGAGKRTTARWAAQRLGLHLLEIDCFEVVFEQETRTEGTLRARFDKAAEVAPSILLLHNVEALARKSQAMETGQEPHMSSVLADCIRGLQRKAAARVNGSESPLPVAVFATTSDPDKCPIGIVGCFKHEIVFDAPGEAERLDILTSALAGTKLSPDVSLPSLATQTAALVASDLANLAARGKAAAIERVIHSAAATAAQLQVAGVALCAADLESALNKARSSYSESIGAPKIPNVTWDDVGGLASVKSDILDTIQLPLEHPELFSDGLKKRSGILLYGPPGTGKTLLAKAVATSCSLNFFSVKGPELLNMYIGESEANVRRVFQRARDAKPCVIFFDELDSVAPKRGNQGDSGGVMDRIVSQLLAELDGMAGGKDGTDVFVIGATNRPDLLDPALLRPGRFDRLLYLSVAESHDAQLNILQALTRKFKLDPDVGDLHVIAEQCPFNLTGADFYALCSDAMLKAMTRKASEVDAKIAELNNAPPSKHPHPLTPQYYLAELAHPNDYEVWVSRTDFEAALAELVPSVSAQEMEHYRQVRRKFETSDDKQQGSLDPQFQTHMRIDSDRRAAHGERSVHTVQKPALDSSNPAAHAPPNGIGANPSLMASGVASADTSASKHSKAEGKARAKDHETLTS